MIRRFVACMLSFAPLQAFACQCPAPHTRASDLIRTKVGEDWSDQILFIGRVASIRQPKPGALTRTTFDVMKVMQGPRVYHLRLAGITENDNSCGLNLQVGEIRLFHAWKDKQNDWFTNVCSQPVDDLGPERLRTIARKGTKAQ
jgi:hypothetical protein